MKLLFTFMLILSLVGCAGSSNSGNPNPQPGQDNKPNSEFTGAPGVFGGKWEGSCEVIVNGTTTSSTCFSTLSFDQTSDEIKGTAVLVTNHVANSLSIPSHKIVGNNVYDGNELVGQIGESAFKLERADIGSMIFTLKDKNSLSFEITKEASATSPDKLTIKGNLVRK